MHYLLAAKTKIPHFSLDVIPRTRLAAQLELGARRKLTLVVAPAGFGKTLAVSTWLQTVAHPPPATPSVAWYALDENDHLPARFLTYLLEAVYAVYPDWGQEVAGLLKVAQLPPVDYLTQVLVRAFEQLPGPLHLVLDDYHLIQAAEIHQLVGGLLAHLPPQAHVIILSRTMPPLALARLRAEDELVQVRAAELCFDDQEGLALVSAVLQRPPRPEAFRLLMEQTAGWVAGLRLAATAMRADQDDLAFVQTIQTHGHEYLFEYLLQEVLQRVPPHLYEFLTKTAILADLTPALCDAVVDAGGRSARILEQLAQDNLFVNRQRAGRGYRYHPQFQLLLRYRLLADVGADGMAHLQRRAAAWYVAHGQVEAALRTYLAIDDVAAAADALAATLPTLYEQDDPRLIQVLAHLLSLLPSTEIDTRPTLIMAEALVYQFRGRYLQIGALADKAQALVDAGQGPRDPQQRTTLQGEIWAAKTFHYYTRGNIAGLMETAQRALSCLPQRDYLVLGNVELMLSRCYRWLGRPDEAVRLLEGTIQAAVLPNARTLAAQLSLSQHYQYMGDLERAVLYAELALTQSATKHYVVDEGIARARLAFLACMRMDHEVARQQLAYVRENPYLVQFTAQLTMAYYQLWYLGLLGETQAAIDLMAQLRVLARELGNTDIQPVLEGLEAHVAYMTGNPVAAMSWAERQTAPPLHPVLQLMRVVWARCMLHKDTPEALALAEAAVVELVTFCRERHDLWFGLESEVLLSLIWARQGNHAAARDLLAQALIRGVPRGFRLLYTGYGMAMDALLAQIMKEPLLAAAWPYARTLLTEVAPLIRCGQEPLPTAPRPGGRLSQPPRPETLSDSLTLRELEILQLMAQNLTNREIAERLVVSPHTVRNHIVHVCAKLGVTKRRDAVTQARNQALLTKN